MMLAAQALTATGGTFGAVVGAPVMGVAIERFGFSAAWIAIAVLPLAPLGGTFFIPG